MKKELREKVYKKYSGHCAYCGCEIKYEEMQVDHIIPQEYFVFRVRRSKNNNEIETFKIPDYLKHLNEEDFNHLDNLMPSCRVCNNWKATYSMESFRTQIANQISQLNKRSSNFRMAKKYKLVTENNIPIKFYFEGD